MLITELINPQGFEVVLNRIGVILAEEIPNQEILQNLNSAAEYYIERQTPYDKSEDVVVNISLSSAIYTSNKKDSQGNTFYNIDVYCRSFDQEVSGDFDARIKLHRYVGFVRYILSSSKYPLLGFPPGLIGGKYIDSMEFDQNINNQDGAYNRFARIVFSVRIQEFQNLWDSIPLDGNDTSIKLNQTELGFKLVKN